MGGVNGGSTLRVILNRFGTLDPLWSTWKLLSAIHSISFFRQTSLGRVLWRVTQAACCCIVPVFFIFVAIYIAFTIPQMCSNVAAWSKCGSNSQAPANHLKDTILCVSQTTTHQRLKNKGPPALHTYSLMCVKSSHWMQAPCLPVIVIFYCPPNNKTCKNVIPSIRYGYTHTHTSKHTIRSSLS